MLFNKLEDLLGIEKDVGKLSDFIGIGIEPQVIIFALYHCASIR